MRNACDPSVGPVPGRRRDLKGLRMMGGSFERPPDPRNPRQIGGVEVRTDNVQRVGRSTCPDCTVHIDPRDETSPRLPRHREQPVISGQVSTPDECMNVKCVASNLILTRPEPSFPFDRKWFAPVTCHHACQEVGPATQCIRYPSVVVNLWQAVADVMEKRQASPVVVDGQV